MLHRALQAVSDTAAKGGRILFVGTKRQAQDAIADAAKRSAQYYVNSRWLGGTLTNWKTISGSISRLRKLDEMLNSGDPGGYTKKERLTMQRERDKLDRSLGGIKDMGGVPDLLFVIDTNKEDIAIKEARRLNIPVAAIVDTNSDPAGITYVVPGNDDASRAVSLYCDLVAKAAIDGISRAQGEAGVDAGAAEKPIVEPVPIAPAPGDLGFEQLPGPRGAIRMSRSRKTHRLSSCHLPSGCWLWRIDCSPMRHGRFRFLRAAASKYGQFASLAATSVEGAFERHAHSGCRIAQETPGRVTRNARSIGVAGPPCPLSPNPFGSGRFVGGLLFAPKMPAWLSGRRGPAR